MKADVRHKVGDRVVALSSSNDPYTPEHKRGVIYKVLSVSYCKKCGCQSIGIGTSSRDYDYTSTMCYCGFRDHYDGSHELMSFRFAPLDNLSQYISEAEQNEDFELAQLLTEIAQQELINSLL